MFKTLLVASIAGLFLLTSYGNSAPSSPPFPNPEAPARLTYLSQVQADDSMFPSIASVPATGIPIAPQAGGGQHPVITQSLSPRKQPDVIVSAGYDKLTGKGYLAWSPNRGRDWIDLSSMLPGSEQVQAARIAAVTRLAEDKQGRLLLTMDGSSEARGKVLHLTLGKKMDWLLL